MDTLDDFLDGKLHGRQKPDATRVAKPSSSAGGPDSQSAIALTEAPQQQGDVDLRTNPPLRGPDEGTPGAHRLAAMEVTAQAPKKEGAIGHLVRALHALINPTAGAEPAPPGLDDEVPPPPLNHEEPGDQIRAHLRAHPEHAAAARKTISSHLHDRLP